MRAITATALGALMILAAAPATAGHRLPVITGRAQSHHGHHVHGPHCRHHRYQRRGPGCYEADEWVRGRYGERLRLVKTVCRDRYGRLYVVPGSRRIVGRH